MSAGLWQVVSGSDPRALAIVDGTGDFVQHGPHYSRRHPGSKTFTGCGQDLVLLTADARAVWAVVHQRTPQARGTVGQQTPFVWRNMLFRNLGIFRSSDLIALALEMTYREWRLKYGTLPGVRLRTEIDVRRVKSTNPGYCYRCAGWESGPTKRGKKFFYAPTWEAAS